MKNVNAAGSLMWSFPNIYVINLAARKDRRTQMIKEFASIGIQPSAVTWFDAIRPEDSAGFESIGARGCFLSHLSIIKSAIAKRQDRILILEDDVDFVSDFQEKFERLAQDLDHRHWDVFYGGGGVESSALSNSGLVKLDCATPVVTTHFVAFQGPVLAKLARYLEAQLSRDYGDPAGGPMHVDGSYTWARRELKLETYFTNPPLCYQRPSRSNIAKQSGVRAYVPEFALDLAHNIYRSIKNRLR